MKDLKKFMILLPKPSSPYLVFLLKSWEIIRSPDILSPFSGFGSILISTSFFLSLGSYCFGAGASPPLLSCFFSSYLGFGAVDSPLDKKTISWMSSTLSIFLDFNWLKCTDAGVCSPASDLTSALIDSFYSTLIDSFYLIEVLLEALLAALSAADFSKWFYKAPETCLAFRTASSAASLIASAAVGCSFLWRPDGATGTFHGILKSCTS